MKKQKFKVLILSVLLGISIFFPFLTVGEYREVSATKMPDFPSMSSITETYVGDDFAFLKSYNDIYIVDISHPESPEFFGNISHYIPQIKDSGGYFYVAVNRNNLYISVCNVTTDYNDVRISNGTLYAFKTSNEKISLESSLSGAFGLITTNGKIVCGLSLDYSTKNLSIELIDFTDSKNPKKVSEIPANMFQTMYLYANDLYVAYSDEKLTKIVRYDITNSKNPFEVSNCTLKSAAILPTGSLSVSENYVGFISTENNTYYLSIWDRNLKKGGSIELSYLPGSITISGDYVFLPQLNSIEVFRIDGDSIEKQTSINVNGTMDLPDAEENNLYFVSQDSMGSVFHIVNFEEKTHKSAPSPSLLENLLIVLIILILSAVSLIIWYKKKEVKPKNERE